jgi:hypothetical protein
MKKKRSRLAEDSKIMMIREKLKKGRQAREA